LSEHYALPKKENNAKSKGIKKDSKKKEEMAAERQKMMKKGLRKFKDVKSKETEFIEKNKGIDISMVDLNEKDRSKEIKNLWKALSEE
jgi:hypothetical protein